MNKIVEFIENDVRICIFVQLSPRRNIHNAFSEAIRPCLFRRDKLSGSVDPKP